MTTYSKETALYDTGAIKNGIDEAATTASKYITYVDQEHGIRVCDGNAENVDVNYTQINSDGMSVHKDSEEVASFGMETRIGSTESANFNLSADGMTGTNADGDVFFNVDYDSGETTGRYMFLKDKIESDLKSNDGLPTATDEYKIYEWTQTFTSDANPISLPSTQNTIDLYSSYAYSSVTQSGYSLSNSYTSRRVYKWNADITFTYGTAKTVTKTLLVTYASSRTIGVRQVIHFDGTVLKITTYASYYNTNSIKRVKVRIFGTYNKTTKAPSFFLGTTDGSRQGIFSCAIGENIRNTENNQLVIGKNNESVSDSAFIIGNGTSDSNRSNAFVVDWDGYIYPQNVKMADFVVEEGTINTYTTYRKWNSGIAECWYHHDVSGITTVTWSGTLAYKDVTSLQTIWQGLFNATPTSIQCQSLNSQFIAIVPYSYDVNGIINLRYLSWGTKSNENVVTSIYAKGTWK